MQKLVDGEKELTEIPSPQRRSKPLELNEYDDQFVSQNETINNAYKIAGYTQKQIGDYFGLHYARMSRIIKKAKPEPIDFFEPSLRALRTVLRILDCHGFVSQ